jgi:membrane-bound acyltransferase YfiQ involved in biofilm formation
MKLMELMSKLVFSNNTYIYILAYVFLPIIVFYNAKIFAKKAYNNEFLSKSSTDCIRGICIVVIILHHIAQRMLNPVLLKPYEHFGYLSVSIFFFLSGYGLWYQL